MWSTTNPKCFDERECFAKNNKHRCELLNSTFADGKCPFCKPKSDYTNGVHYQYIPRKD